MTKVQAIAMVVGIAMPFLVTFLKQDGLSKTWNLIISLVACGIAGVVVVWASGASFTWSNIVGVIGLVFAAAQAIYAAYWSKTAFNAKVGSKTSFIR